MAAETCFSAKLGGGGGGGGVGVWEVGAIGEKREAALDSGSLLGSGAL